MKPTTFLLAAVLLAACVNPSAQTSEEWTNRGNAEMANKNYKSAIEYYQKAIEADSNCVEAYYNTGMALAYIYEIDKAIEYFNIALILNDTLSNTYFVLSYCYELNQDFDNAIDLLKKGIDLQPDTPEQHFNLSLLYHKKGSSAYAELYFKKAAQLGYEPAQEYYIDNELSWEDDFVKPDYEQIKSNIENTQSNLYYPKLWDRFQKGDYTMTLDENRHLYYGYVFHKDYSPYTSNSNEEQITAILGKENPTKEEWEKLISLLDIALKTEPFNCTYLIHLEIASHHLNRLKDVERNSAKIGSISDALKSTGDGLTKETAIHVISIYSEYDYLFFERLSKQNQALIEKSYDVLYLQPNNEGITEMWFDVTQPLKYIEVLSK